MKMRLQNNSASKGREKALRQSWRTEKVPRKSGLLVLELLVLEQKETRRSPDVCEC